MSATALARKAQPYVTTARERRMSRRHREANTARSRTAFADWIEQVGEGRISAICGLSAVTPHVWKHMGRVPRAHWPELLIALEAEGLTLGGLLRLEADYHSKLPAK